MYGGLSHSAKMTRGLVAAGVLLFSMSALPRTATAWGTASPTSVARRARTSVSPRWSSRPHASDEAAAAAAEPAADAAMTIDNNRPEIAVAASLEMPFAPAECFDAFADFPRQRRWSPWLRSVEYLDDGGDDVDDGGGGGGGGAARREMKWVVGLLGVRFSYRAVATRLERPRTVAWESTTGLKLRGRAEFDGLLRDEAEGGGSAAAATRMTLRLAFVAPRVAATVFRRASSVGAFS